MPKVMQALVFAGELVKSLKQGINISVPIGSDVLRVSIKLEKMKEVEQQKQTSLFD